MSKFRYVGAAPAYIQDRLVEPGDVVELSGDTVVQTADVCPDEPLFEAVNTTPKKAAKAEDKE